MSVTSNTSLLFSLPWPGLARELWFRAAQRPGELPAFKESPAAGRSLGWEVGSAALELPV